MDALALFYFCGGSAAVDAPWLEVAGGNGCESEYRAFADFDSGGNAGAGADPGVRSDSHRVSEQGECGIVEVVSGSAEVSVLREDSVGTETGGGRVIDFGAVAGGDLVFADEVPRGPDARCRIEVAVGTHLCAEDTEQHRSPCVKGARR